MLRYRFKNRAVAYKEYASLPHNNGIIAGTPMTRSRLSFFHGALVSAAFSALAEGFKKNISSSFEIATMRLFITHFA